VRYVRSASPFAFTPSLMPCALRSISCEPTPSEGRRDRDEGSEKQKAAHRD
jgi:hypothetical protein